MFQPGGACRFVPRPVRQQWGFELSRQHLLRPEVSAGTAGRARPGRRTAALERRRRRLRPPADDRRRDPPGGGELSQLRRRDVARCRTPQHHAGEFRAFHRRPDARPADHGPDGFAARVHQGDLGLSRHPRERQPPRQGPRSPRQIQAAVRRRREGLWRRPLHHRLDLGHRIQLLDANGRPQRPQFDGDAGLRRPPPGLLQGRVPHRARNPQPRRSASGTVARFLGRCVRADPVHADRLQALRRGRRRRWPPRRRRQSRPT